MTRGPKPVLAVRAAQAAAQQARTCPQCGGWPANYVHPDGPPTCRACADEVAP